MLRCIAGDIALDLSNDWNAFVFRAKGYKSKHSRAAYSGYFI